jgi:four helix bundle protein
LATKSIQDYGYRDQLSRSGLSVPSNIAEGLERISDKEKVRFLDVVIASAAEVKTQIIIGAEINYLEFQQVSTWITELEIIGKMISSLINSIQRQIK